MTGLKLPPDYSPFPVLVLCSNELENVRAPIVIGRNPVLLIGKSESGIARVWIKRPIGSPEGTTWQDLVIDNKAADPDVKVVQSGPSSGVYLKGETLMHVTVESPGERAVVISLDLRAIGINIFGNMGGLNIATNSYIGNHFKNIESMLILA